MLAEKMEVSIGHIYKIERGDSIINMERLAQICLILKLPIEDMIAGCVDMEMDASPVISALTQEKINVIHTLLKGQPRKVTDMVTEVIHDIIRGLNEPDDESE